jgi:hypothetical protein
MKKLSYLIVFCTLLFSCNNEKLVKKEVVDFLDNEVSKTLPRKDDLVDISAYIALPLFVSIDNNKLALTNIQELYTVYNLSYKNEYENFNYYLSKSLNQEIILNGNNFLKPFTIDKVIKSDYENTYFNDFFDRYTIKKQNYTTINEDKLNNKNQLFTFMYYLSINNYYCSLDDYGGGVWHVKNWNNTIKK